jgi:hypothetical protein
MMAGAPAPSVRQFPPHGVSRHDVVASASVFSEPKPALLQRDHAIDRQAAGFGGDPIAHDDTLPIDEIPVMRLVHDALQGASTIRMDDLGVTITAQGWLKAEGRFHLPFTALPPTAASFYMTD